MSDSSEARKKIIEVIPDLDWDDMQYVRNIFKAQYLVLEARQPKGQGGIKFRIGGGF